MKILLVESESNPVAYLRKGLIEQGYDVDFASDGDPGLLRGQILDYDVIILDVPTESFLAAAQPAHPRENRQTPIIMAMTGGRLTDHYSLEALGFEPGQLLVMPTSFLDLLARLQAISQRGVTMAPLILIDDLELDMLSRRARRAGKPLDLTAKEFALLAILAQGQSRILSKGTIAELAWGIGFDSNTKVVETAINRLSVKIDGPGQNKLLHTVRGMGYALAHRPGERS